MSRRRFVKEEKRINYTFVIQSTLIICQSISKRKSFSVGCENWVRFSLLLPSTKHTKRSFIVINWIVFLLVKNKWDGKRLPMEVKTENRWPEIELRLFGVSVVALKFLELFLPIRKLELFCKFSCFNFFQFALGGSPKLGKISSWGKFTWKSLSWYFLLKLF